MADPVVSIILPVYNVAPYLRQCMDSVLGQRYENFELICIDDGSDDGTADILREYEAADARVRVFGQAHQGLAAGRNRGIALARGAYLLFVDGDDWLEKDACAVLMGALWRYRPDVILFDYYREYAGRSLRKNVFDESLRVFDEAGCRTLHRRQAGLIGSELRKPQHADALCSMCTKLYRADLVREHRVRYIPNSVIGSNGDGLFNLFYFGHVRSAVYIGRPLYHYRKTNPNSNITRYKPRFRTRWNAMFDIIGRYIERRGLPGEFREGLRNRIALSVIGLGLNALSNPAGLAARYAEVDEILGDPRIRAALAELPTRFMPLHWLIFFGCARRRRTAAVYGLLLAIRRLKAVV